MLKKISKVEDTRLQSMVHHCKYLLFTFDLDLRFMVAQNIAQSPPHHETYATAKFEAATFHGLGNALKR